MNVLRKYESKLWTNEREMKCAFRIIALFGIIIGILVMIPYGFYHYTYPYGLRPAVLACMLTDMRVYASEHNGQYPNGTNMYDALSKLYPRYVGVEAAGMLAGLSGDPSNIEKKLKDGKTFGSNDCSWVYFPGLHEADDGSIALIYERTSGISENGRRRMGRVVGFINGAKRQILDNDWSMFMAEQERRRKEAMSKRSRDRF